MDRRLKTALDADWAVYASCAVSLVCGLFFMFVWAPHPWGWRGFDHYHDLAIDLTAGRPFSTMEVPWAYAYFLAAFYRTFGVHPYIPLVVQVALNALVPLLVFALARTWFGRRTAVLAAMLTGAFSFNTIYASTESSDALCTVLFMIAIVVFTRGLAARGGSPPASGADLHHGLLNVGGLAWFGAAGALTGLASQFRPNLILLPLLLSGYAFWTASTRRRLAQALALMACAGAALAPWVVRNYALTRGVIPTSVHGGVQLWYGTLQVGPYLNSRAYNPRSVFEAPAFEYTSLQGVPVVVEAEFNCDEEALDDVALVYWSDLEPAERRLAPARVDGRHYVFEIAAPQRRVVIYYYFTTSWSGPSGRVERTTPRAGARAPFVYFVSGDHLGDLDRYGDLLDVFDIVRLVRHAAWAEPVPFGDKLEAAGVRDVRAAVGVLMRPILGAGADTAVSGVDSDAMEAQLTFSDGSRIVVPRHWSGRVTELSVTGNVASTLMTSRRSLRALNTHARQRLASVEECAQAGTIAVNQVFYRREPHMMRRYTALAFDNIRIDPIGFVLASAYRAVRLFVIEGASDPFTAHQFTRSRRIYAAGTAVSLVMLALCAAGVVVAWRRGQAVGLPLLLLGYVPATLAPVLTNMRYTVTIQPLMFMFIAVALTAAPRHAGAGRG